jgi:hypothetical protein
MGLPVGAEVGGAIGAGPPHVSTLHVLTANAQLQFPMLESNNKPLAQSFVLP